MNKLSGKICGIESSATMSAVEVDVDGDVFSSIVLETPASVDYLKLGAEIGLLFKESEVSIAKNLTGLISLRNRIPSKVKQVDRSEILTTVVLDYKGREVVSLISTKSAKRLDLKVGDSVEWLVKMNEVSLCPSI